MKKIIVLNIVILILFITLTSCSQGDAEIEPNGIVVYNRVTLINDETNLYVSVGYVDYVFVGTVTELLKNISDLDCPDSVYKINVIENLKGSLTDTQGNLVDTVEVRKHGGYRKDGTLVLSETDFTKDSGLPEIGKQYIFLAFGQHDGSLLLAQINGNIEYTDSVKADYIYYIENQIEAERERYPYLP